MEEQWVVTRLRTSTKSFLKNGQVRQVKEEEWLIGKGSTLQDAVADLKFNERHPYEKPKPLPPAPRRLGKYEQFFGDLYGGADRPLHKSQGKRSEARRPTSLDDGDSGISLERDKHRSKVK